MKVFFILISLLLIIANTWSQNTTDTIDNGIDYSKIKFNSTHVFSGFNFSYSISNYPFAIKDLSQADFYFNQVNPFAHNSESFFKHQSQANIELSFNWSSKLFHKESKIFGKLHAGILFCDGSRLNLVHSSDYFSSSEIGFVNGDSVSNLDSIIVSKREYSQRSQDLGFSFAYTLANSPADIFVFETGIGTAFLFSVHQKIFYVDSESVNLKYLDPYQRLKYDYFITSNLEDIDHSYNFLIRLFVPVSFSYKINSAKNFAISTFLSAGIEAQKTNKSSFYIHPYYSLGFGLKYFIK